MGRPPIQRPNGTVIRPANGDTRFRPAGDPPERPVPQSSRPSLPDTPAPFPSPAVDSWGVPIAANENILLRASGGLLRLLGQLRAAVVRASISTLTNQVARAVDEFGREVRAAGIPEKQVEIAAFALCATADDIIQNLPDGLLAASGGTETGQAHFSITGRFFTNRKGGVIFFDNLEAALREPEANYHVLELMYVCLSLGFQGKYRFDADGRPQPNGGPQLEQIQWQLYQTLRRVRPNGHQELSPHWRGMDIPPPKPGFRIPRWAPASCVLLLLFGVFVIFRLMLGSDADVVASDLRRLFPEVALTLERPPIVAMAQAAPAPAPSIATPAASPRPADPPPQPPAPTQLERIRTALAPEVAAANVFENGPSIFIRLGESLTFPSGSATVPTSFLPLGNRIADVLAKEPGEIRISGHTDSVNIFTLRFPSNYELSLERAKALAAVLQAQLPPGPPRIKVEGLADTKPLDTNASEAGRARNRRVEISIPREETLRGR